MRGAFHTRGLDFFLSVFDIATDIASEIGSAESHSPKAASGLGNMTRFGYAVGAIRDFFLPQKELAPKICLP